MCLRTEKRFVEFFLGRGELPANCLNRYFLLDSKTAMSVHPSRRSRYSKRRGRDGLPDRNKLASTEAPTRPVPPKVPATEKLPRFHSRWGKATAIEVSVSVLDSGSRGNC